MGDHWKLRGGGGSQKPTILKESMKLKWKYISRGVGGNVQPLKPSTVEVRIRITSKSFLTYLRKIEVTFTAYIHVGKAMFHFKANKT